MAASEDSTVQVVRSDDGTVWTVAIDRPHVRNAVDGATARALHAAFVAFDADPDTRVAVLTGRGGAFCAGADLKALAAVGAAAAPSGFALDDDFDAPHPRGPMGPTRLELAKPVIAAVEGHAVAGGLELALWCDLRVVARSAVFGVYCRRFGVPLIDGGTVRLPRLIGESRAMDLVLTGRSVDAEEALAIGLANRVVDDGRALAEAEALAHALAALPQTCLRNDRASVRAQSGCSSRDALRQEFAFGMATLRSGESVAGAARFVGGVGRHGAGPLREG